MKIIPYQKEAGFTLLELLVTVIIAGILAAIAAPNFYGLLKSNEVNEGIASLENALKEAQKIAIRESKECSVTLNTTNKTIASTTPSPPNKDYTGCSPTQRDIATDLNIYTDKAGNTVDIAFSYKGNTSDSYTIVVASDFTTNVKCLFIANGLGAMKVGEYTGSLTGNNPTISSASCNPAD